MAVPRTSRVSVDGSLARLGTDYIDLYLLHVPDANTPILETLTALNELVDAGKVREIGCSNFTADMLDEAASVAAQERIRPFVNVQNNYSLLDRGVETDALPAVERLGITLVPYFPLASGVLTGKYKRGEPAPEGTRLAAWGDRAGNFLTDERMRHGRPPRASTRATTGTRSPSSRSRGSLVARRSRA